METGSIYNAYPRGRPSGLPTDIVNQLVQVKEQQQLKPIERDVAEAQNLKDVYSGMNSTLKDFYQTVNNLNNADAFEVLRATSTNTDVLTASGSSDAYSGSYNIDVGNLAQAHNVIVGEADGSADGTVTQGIADPGDALQATTFSFEHNGSTFSYDTTDMSLSDLVQAINDDDEAQILAQVIEVDSGYVLTLKSGTTGGGDNQVTNITGDIYGGGLETEEAQAGIDASFKVDGVSHTSSGNQVTDAVPGVTLQLKATGQAYVGVSVDTESITAKVQAMVDAYNKIDTYMDDYATFDQETGEAGPLLGESLPRTVMNQIKRVLTGPVQGSENNAYQYLSQVGITIQNDGTLKLDTAKLEQALIQDSEAVGRLFVTDQKIDGHEIEGIAEKLNASLGSYTNTYDGLFKNKIDNLSDRVKNLTEDYEDTQDEIARYSDRITKKYSDLEEKVLAYQSMQEQLSSMIDTWQSDDDD